MPDGQRGRQPGLRRTVTSREPESQHHPAPGPGPRARPRGGVPGVVSPTGRRRRPGRVGAQHRARRRGGRLRRPCAPRGRARAVVPPRAVLGAGGRHRHHRGTTTRGVGVHDPLTGTADPGRGETPSSRFDRSRPYSSGPRLRLTARPFHGSDDPRSGRCSGRSQGTFHHFTIRLTGELVALRPSGDLALRRSLRLPVGRCSFG